MAVGVAALAVLASVVLFLILRPPKAAVDEVLRESVVLTLALTGRIEPRLEAELRPLASGRLMTLTKAEGDAIHEGEILGRVDIAPARAALEQAEAARAAQSARVEQFQRDLGRVRDLYDQGVVARQELEDAELAMSTSQDELVRLSEAVRQAQSTVRDRLLVAPFDGIVLSRPVDPGQVVGPETVVYRVATRGMRHIEVDVDERYLEMLEPQMPAVVAPIGSDKTYGATVTYVGDEVDAAAGTAIVRLAFVGVPPELTAGLSIDINIAVAQFDNAITVAREAVLDPGGGARVLVISDGELEERAVRVFDWQSDRIVVFEGLQPGDRVALDPRSHRAGDRVRPVESARG